MAQGANEQDDLRYNSERGRVARNCAIPETMTMDDQSKDPWEKITGAEASSNGRIQWTRELARMKVQGGWLYRTSTEHYNASGIVTACSESLCPVMDPKPARK